MPLLAPVTRAKGLLLPVTAGTYPTTGPLRVGARPGAASGAARPPTPARAAGTGRRARACRRSRMSSAGSPGPGRGCGVDQLRQDVVSGDGGHEHRSARAQRGAVRGGVATDEGEREQVPGRQHVDVTSTGGTAASRSVRYSSHSPPMSSSAATAGWVSRANGRDAAGGPAPGPGRGRARSARVTGAAVARSSGATIPSSRCPATWTRRSCGPADTTSPTTATAIPADHRAGGPRPGRSAGRDDVRHRARHRATPELGADQVRADADSWWITRPAARRGW